MKYTLNVAVTMFTMAALVGCAGTPKKSNTEILAETANNTVDGTVGAFENGTGRISNINNKPVQSITKAPSVANASDPVSDQNLKDAALSPLEDLNIRRREIDELLVDLDNPYAPLVDQSCASYVTSIAELDGVLGVDYDSPDVELNSSDKFRDRANDVMLAGVNEGAGLFVPGRGVIREVTGAGPRERYLRALYQRGVARRGFLKGSGLASGCKLN